MNKRDILRNAIEAYRHAERWHLNSRDPEIWEDGWRIKELANQVCILLCGREIKPRKSS